MVENVVEDVVEPKPDKNKAFDLYATESRYKLILDGLHLQQVKVVLRLLRSG